MSDLVPELHGGAFSHAVSTIRGREWLIGDLLRQALAETWRMQPRAAMAGWAGVQV